MFRAALFVVSSDSAAAFELRARAWPVACESERGRYPRNTAPPPLWMLPVVMETYVSGSGLDVRRPLNAGVAVFTPPDVCLTPAGFSSIQSFTRFTSQSPHCSSDQSLAPIAELWRSPLRSGMLRGRCHHWTLPPPSQPRCYRRLARPCATPKTIRSQSAPEICSIPSAVRSAAPPDPPIASAGEEKQIPRGRARVRNASECGEDRRFQWVREGFMAS